LGFGKTLGLGTAIALMAVTSVLLYLVFKAKDWL